MPAHHLAQLNIARMKAPLESEVMSGFREQLDAVNALADEAEGFVWRLQSEDGDATSYRPFGDDHLVNLSVWRDLDALRNYVFLTDHAQVMRQRRDWFERMREPHLVLWWVPRGHVPTLEESSARLFRLRTEGPSVHAFDFARSFAAPD